MEGNEVHRIFFISGETTFVIQLNYFRTLTSIDKIYGQIHAAAAQVDDVAAYDDTAEVYVDDAAAYDDAAAADLHRMKIRLTQHLYCSKLPVTNNSNQEKTFFGLHKNYTLILYAYS